MLATPRRLALLALGISAIASSPAAAASYEQLSRGTGTIGFGAIDAPAFPGPASDTGLFGIYAQPNAADGLGATFASLGRNVVSDRTATFRGDGRLIDIDRSERVGLTYDFDPPRARFSVGPMTGGTQTEVVDLPGGGTAALSGDGGSVVYADYDGGTSRYDVATKTTTPLSTSFVGIDRFSVSDDGRTVAGFALDPELGVRVIGVVLRDGVRTELGGRAYVSGNGRTVFYLEDGGRVLVTRTVATGAETRTPVPPALGLQPNVIWVSPDGTQIALGPVTDSAQTDGAPPTASAQAFHTDDGRWYRFGGAYSRYLYDGGSSLGRFQVSRSGRFATLEFNEQVALVSFGSTLPGAGDPISPAAYFGGTGAVRCGADATFGVYLAQPAPWITKPRSASVVVRADGVVVKEGTLGDAYLPGTAAAVDDPALTVTFGPEVQRVTVQWTVVDGLGRTYRETYGGALRCSV